MQAAASAHEASYMAGDPGQLLVDVTDSGEVARHRRVERDGLTQVCHSQYYSETPCMSAALPERPDRNGEHAQVQVWRSYASAQRTQVTSDVDPRGAYVEQTLSGRARSRQPVPRRNTTNVAGGWKVVAGVRACRCLRREGPGGAESSAAGSRLQ